MEKNTSNFCKLPNCYPVSLENIENIENFENETNYNYDINKIYKVNDIVIFNNIAYKMIDSIGVSGYAPSNTSYWNKLIWDSSKKYNVNDIFTMINYSGNRTYKVILGQIGVNSWKLIDSGPQDYYVWSETVPSANHVSSKWPIDSIQSQSQDDFTMLSSEYYEKLSRLESPYYKNFDNFSNSKDEKIKEYKLDGTYFEN